MGVGVNVRQAAICSACEDETFVVMELIVRL